MSLNRRATAIVLAGGRSTRMGRDKALLEIGGRAIVSRAIDAVSLVCDEVIVASGQRTLDLPATCAVQQVADPPGAAGPLAGVVAGMEGAVHDRCIVVACDMPFLSADLICYLLDCLDGCDAAVPVFGGSPQPLQAAYSAECLSTAECILRLGGSSMRSFLERLRVRYVSEGQCAWVDPNGLSGLNVNRPEDLLLADSLYAASRRHATAVA